MPSPFIIQRVLSLQLKNLEDSAGSFPGDLEGANTQIIIGNQDSSFIDWNAPSHTRWCRFFLSKQFL